MSEATRITNITDTAILTGYGVNAPAQGFGVTGGSKRQQLMVLQQQRRLALLRQLNKFSISWPTSKKNFEKKSEIPLKCIE